REPKYTEGEKMAVYSGMAGMAEDAVRSGRDAVVDATFYLKSERERYAEIARNAATRFFIIVCRLDEDEARKRLGRRYRGGPSDADYEVYLKVRDSFEPVEGPHLEIDTSLPKPEMLERVMGYLGR
ncbi:MAG: AAA family ATPase, partial [Candidatus Micrarchaeota archaeon]